MSEQGLPSHSPPPPWRMVGLTVSVNRRYSYPQLTDGKTEAGRVPRLAQCLKRVA